MKINLLIFLVIGVSCTLTYGQTKLIAHKSHSGNNSTFKKRMNHMVSVNRSSFGRVDYTIKRLDTVEHISDSFSVLSKSYYNSYKLNDAQPAFVKHKRDTIYNFPYFRNSKSLDSFKSNLKKSFQFNNDMDSVVFIGQENLKKVPIEKEKKKNSTFPVIVDNDSTPPFDFKWIGVLCIGCISLIIGYITYSKNQNKEVHTKKA
ncbi:hypothetical protein GCM10022393_29350 [Aquimarina addita]|uniref:Uncharacterized protein n=1 Tax=Aquimarina addita TaxID=870485 RepID=A0ABP6UMW4_9FLAO